MMGHCLLALAPWLAWGCCLGRGKRRRSLTERRSRFAYRYGMVCGSAYADESNSNWPPQRGLAGGADVARIQPWEKAWPSTPASTPGLCKHFSNDLKNAKLKGLSEPQISGKLPRAARRRRADGHPLSAWGSSEMQDRFSDRLWIAKAFFLTYQPPYRIPAPPGPSSRRRPSQAALDRSPRLCRGS